MKKPEIRKLEREPRLFGVAAPVRSAVIPPLSAARWLLVFIVAAGVYFFHGFLFPVLAALVIAFASWPLYSRLLTRVNGRRTLAASIAILFILGFIVGPVVFAATYASHEIRDWIGWAVETNRTGAPTPDWIRVLPVIGGWLDMQWTRFLDHPGAIGVKIGVLAWAILVGDKIVERSTGCGPRWTVVLISRLARRRASHPDGRARG